jgi:drug/metabolite transporter (DMT)-like permease
VAILVGLGPVALTPPVWVAIGASLSAAFLYAVAAVYMRLNLQDIPPVASVTFSQLCAAVVMLPAIPFVLPQHMPTPAAIGSLVVLALACTALAYVIYFRLIAKVGPVRATLVTYLAPGFGMLWGALFLHESLTWGMAAGFGLVLASVALISSSRNAAIASR